MISRVIDFCIICIIVSQRANDSIFLMGTLPLASARPFFCLFTFLYGGTKTQQKLTYFSSFGANNLNSIRMHVLTQWPQNIETQRSMKLCSGEISFNLKWSHTASIWCAMCILQQYLRIEMIANQAIHELISYHHSFKNFATPGLFATFFFLMKMAESSKIMSGT